jgi:hypothetical protein
MADNGSARAQLSNAASFIKIGSRDWRLGEKICSTGTTAVEKVVGGNVSKMRERFGDQWATARL